MRLLENRAAVALLAVLAAVFLVYANSLPNDFTFDDHPIVENNVVLAEGTLSEVLASPFWPGQPELGLYRPVTLLSFWLNRWIGDDPVGFRIVNLILHALAAWGVYLLLSTWFGHASGLVAAIVFAVHAVHAESVNAIVGRAELLAGGGVLFAWYAFGRGAGAWRLISLGCFAIACLSKEHAVVFPAFLVAEQLWLRRSGPVALRLLELARDYRSWLPYIGVAIAAVLLRMSVTGALTIPRQPDFVDNPLAHTDAVSRVWTSIGVLARYVVLVLAPLDLSVDYSYNAVPVTSFADPVVIAGFGLLAGMLSLAWRSASGEAGGVFGLGCVIFLVGWLPVSNLLFAIGTPMNERLLYLPSIGFAILVGAGYGRLEATMDGRRSVVLAVVVCALLGGRTVIRNAEWKNDFSLFSSAVQASPNSAKAWFNLGNAIRDEGNLPGALDAYARAVEIYPGYAEVHYNRGVVHAAGGDRERAIDAYRQAVEVAPDHVNTLNNLGILLARAGDADEAITFLDRAGALAPMRADIQFNLGLALEARDAERAAGAYARALALWPGYEDAGVNLALLHRAGGRSGDAIGVLQSVVSANGKAPRASFELARALEQAGRGEDALEHYRRVWRAGGEVGLVSRFRMGVLFGRAGRADSARVALETFVAEWRGTASLRRQAEQLLSNLR